MHEIEVIDFAGTDLLVERLHELGFHKGCLLRVVGKAPFGGPLLVQLNTTTIALRDEESACLMIRE